MAFDPFANLPAAQQGAAQPTPAAPTPSFTPDQAGGAFNPFANLPQGGGGQQLAASAQTSPTDPNQQASLGGLISAVKNGQSIPQYLASAPQNGGAGYDMNTDLNKALRASVGQALTLAGQDVDMLARDIGSSIGLTSKDATQAKAQQFAQEQSDFSNIPAVSQYPITSSIVSQGGRYALEAALPGAAASKAGLTGSVAKTIAGDFLTNAAVGAGQQAPADAQNVWASRAQAGLVQGAIGAAVSAPLRYLAGMKDAVGASTPAEQQATADAFKQAGITPTVGQITGNKDTQALEAEIAGVAGVGGKAKLLAQQAAIKTGQENLVKSITPSSQDINTLLGSLQDTTKSQLPQDTHIISAAIPGLRPEEISQNAATLMKAAQDAKLQVSPITGKLGDTQTPGVMLQGATDQQAQDLAKAINQPTYSTINSGVVTGKSISGVPLGTKDDFVLSKTQPQGDFTQIPGVGFLSTADNMTPKQKIGTIMDALTQKGNNVPLNTTPTMNALGNLAKQIQSKVGVGPGDNIVLQKIGAIQTAQNPTFAQLVDFRRSLDDSVFTESGLQAGGPATKALGQLRDIIKTAETQHMDSAGLGPQWGQANKLYQQNKAYDTMSQMLSTSYDPMKGASVGKGALNFAGELQKQQEALYPMLNQEQKQAYQGAIKIAGAAATNLSKVKPGVNVMTSMLSGGLAAGVGAMHMPLAVAGVVTTKALSMLLNSDAGRALLTHAGGLAPSSPVLANIASRVLQGTSSIIVNKVRNPQGS